MLGDVQTHLENLPEEFFSPAGCSAKKPGGLEILVKIVFIALIGIFSIITFW